MLCVAENQIWISPWELPYALNSFFEPHAGHGIPDASALTVNLYEYFVEGILTIVRGQTSGSPNDGDFDTFTTNFNSCHANLGANFLNNNVTSLGILPEFPTDEILVRSCNKLFGVILKGRLEFEGELLLSTPE